MFKACRFRLDAAFVLLFLLLGQGTARSASKVYSRVATDPFGAAQRLLSGETDAVSITLLRRVQLAAPGVSATVCRNLLVGMALTLLCSVLVMCWTVVGILQIFFALLSGSNMLAVVAGGCCVGLRLRFCLDLGRRVARILDVKQRAVAAGAGAA
mmetsp:Transcript_35874/g.65821  ORF Transcript_35874/g.65821 Transcript_35874/m.65821 type:complete len:155 (+) Transcript_35874:778-1242(+)